jgi:GH25 family lysozyme M1 (1,4-beta-N-acetylmuramidase)
MAFIDDLRAAEAALAREQQEFEQAQRELDAARFAHDTLAAQRVPDVADVSEFQGDIDWAAYGKAAPLAFARVNDGDRRDARFTAGRATAMRAAGVIVGTYSFGRCAAPGNGERDGYMEAAMCCWFAWEQGALRPGDMPLVYDYEQSAASSADSFNGQPAAKAARHLVQFVSAYKALRGHWPGVYTNPNTWNQLRPNLTAADLAVVASCWLWQAEWGVASPRRLDGLPGASFHQYTSTGRIPGVATDVDMNRCLLSRSELEVLRIR